MKRLIQLFVIISFTVVIVSTGVMAEGLNTCFNLLQKYELIQSQTFEQQISEYTGLIHELTKYSDYENNLFIDLMDTLKKYAQVHNLHWKQADVAKVAWSLKAINQALQKYDFTFTHHFETGYELEVIHEHGDNKPNTYLYKNPFKHDVDGNGEVDFYDEDEYMRQYINVQLGVTGPQMDAALNLKASLNYFGTGYLEEDGYFARQYDLTLPRLNDFTASIVNSHFAATIGEKQILGFRDYLYYDDPANPDDYNLSGISFVAPYGIFFALGQETVRDWNDPTQTRDLRWIATGTEGLGFLPVNLYLTEQEIQSLDFHKVGRNVVFALTFDLKFPRLNVCGDLALNDSGDGFYTQVSIDSETQKLAFQGKLEVAEHFTPIQPKGDFANTTYVRTFYNGERYAFPARTQRGVEILSQYELQSAVKVYGEYQQYLDANNYKMGLKYQILPEFMVNLAGKYDYAKGKIWTVEMESSYKRSFGSLYARKVFGGTGDLEIRFEPIYANKQVTVKGLLGFGMQKRFDLKNVQMGVELSYHPVENFTFYAKYASEDMDYDVDLPGLNFTRTGRIEYQMNEWISANVTFENIDFRNAKYGYLVEYTHGGIQIQF